MDLLKILKDTPLIVHVILVFVIHRLRIWPLLWRIIRSAKSCTKASISHWRQERNITAFGHALESVAIRTLTFPPLDVNHEKRNQNCVSVTIAKILRFSSVNELWKSVYGEYSYQNEGIPKHMENDTRCLIEVEIGDLIRRTEVGVYWRVFGCGSKHCKPLTKENAPKASWCTRYGAAYLRAPNSMGQVTGHCVVMDPENLKFTCYQQNPNGTDVTNEVMNATRVVVFGLSKATFEVRETSLERRKHLLKFVQGTVVF